MNKVVLVLTIIIALLSLAAGAAKVMQTPQEVEFLTGQGLNLNLIIAFGVFQILGGILLLVPKTKLIGSVISLIAFTASAILVFNSGNINFTLISIIPVFILLLLIYLDRIKN
ncbi:DoxX family protein [Kangiella sp. HZ709]|uniref:DoxX family protein n=1 Tax=Kangiella sp. HZ709 TaxID=2666328 RepID=UPI0012AF4154|nr:DoxX family protein [Kangiella sp. HZ709]MRX27198.1 hypothetical protein [Kangiella sp. HZ709]